MMARFTVLGLLAFCLATAAAQQQPAQPSSSRLRGSPRISEEEAAAIPYAVITEPNKLGDGPDAKLAWRDSTDAFKQENIERGAIVTMPHERESEWLRGTDRAQEQQQPEGGAKQISVFGDRESDWPRVGSNRAQEQQQEGAKAVEGGAKQISVFGDRESDWPRVGSNRAQEQQGLKQQEEAEPGHN